MNKFVNKLWLLITISLVTPILTSCSDDDNDKTTDYAQKISGSYNGSITVPAMAAFGIPAQTISDVDISISRDDTNKATVKMNETLPIAGQQVPLNVSCPVTATDDNGKTKFTGNTIASLETPINILGQNYTQLPVSINGNIDSSNKATIGITVLGMITVDFAGTKK